MYYCYYNRFITIFEATVGNASRRYEKLSLFHIFEARPVTPVHFTVLQRPYTFNIHGPQTPCVA